MDVTLNHEEQSLDLTPLPAEARAQAEAAIARAQGVNPYLDRVFKTPEGYKARKRDIVLYPDTRLEQRSEELGFNPDVKPTYVTFVQKLAADMVATATAADAAGLSAIQIGVPMRVVVIRVSKTAGEYVALVNPVVVDSPNAVGVTVTEGCLSFPGVIEKVERSSEVIVTYQDLDGNEQFMTLVVDDEQTGVAAQAVQHEVEHLEGKLLIQSLNFIHRERVRNHMKKVHRQLDTLRKKTGGRLVNCTALFGYAPDPEEKPAVPAPAP